MRGRLNVFNGRTNEDGNTPAYAGKTLLALIVGLVDGKHPRVCGEDFSISLKLTFCPETPPRMRGRLNFFQDLAVAAGNTPAYAGKTCKVPAMRFRGRKHPRVCGEDQIPWLVSTLGAETPPRMRGRPCNAPPGACTMRNTPAYAGKTVSRFMAVSHREKHPRVCGEDP